MYIVTYTYILGNSMSDNEWESAKLCETLDEAIEFIQFTYEMPESYRSVLLWNGDEIEYDVEFKITVKD